MYPIKYSKKYSLIFVAGFLKQWNNQRAGTCLEQRLGPVINPLAYFINAKPWLIRMWFIRISSRNATVQCKTYHPEYFEFAESMKEYSLTSSTPYAQYRHFCCQSPTTSFLNLHWWRHQCTIMLVHVPMSIWQYEMQDWYHLEDIRQEENPMYRNKAKDLSVHNMCSYTL